MTKTNYILILAVIILVSLLSITMANNRSLRAQYKHNVSMMDDTLQHYKLKSQEQVTRAKALELSIRDLRQANSTLYDELVKLKVKSTATQVVMVDNIVELPVHDTVFVKTSQEFIQPFSFSDKWHILNGNISSTQDSLQMHINTNRVLLSYTLATDKDRNIYMKTDNPYVQVTQMQGMTLPSQRRTTHWALGPSITIGYGLDKQVHVTAGLSLTYGLLRW